MLDDLRYDLCYNCSNFLYTLEYKGYVKMEEIRPLFKLINWFVPKRKPEEQELVNIKNLHPIRAKRLITRLQEDIKSYEEAEANLLVKIEEINKLLDLNTYTSVYYAIKQWRDFWKSHTLTHPTLFVGQHRPKIAAMAQRISKTKGEMWRS